MSVDYSYAVGKIKNNLIKHNFNSNSIVTITKIKKTIILGYFVIKAIKLKYRSIIIDE